MNVKEIKQEIERVEGELLALRQLLHATLIAEDEGLQRVLVVRAVWASYDPCTEDLQVIVRRTRSTIFVRPIGRPDDEAMAFRMRSSGKWVGYPSKYAHISLKLNMTGQGD